VQATGTPVPTSSFGEQATPAPGRTGPPLSLTLILLGMCCLFGVLLGVVILGFVVRRENRQERPNAK
jgi:cytochrome c-type biogenesis protein CcmH/NrfF